MRSSRMEMFKSELFHFAVLGMILMPPLRFPRLTVNCDDIILLQLLESDHVVAND